MALDDVALAETIERWQNSDLFGMRGEQATREIPDGRIAEQFIKRLANDIIMDGDAASMEQLVEQLLESAGSPEAAANKLIDALGAKGLSDGLPESGPRHEAWEHVKEGIREIFKEGGSAAEIATALREGNIPTPTTNDPDKETHLWTLFNQAGANFEITLTDEQLQALKYALNRIAPGLGDVVGTIFDGMFGLEREESIAPADVAQRQAQQSFEGAFNAMKGNAGLAAFHGVAVQNEAGEYVSPWNSHPNNDDEYASFFRRNDEIDPNTVGSTYMFYPSGNNPEGYTPERLHDGAEFSPGEMYANFEDMILRKLEADGTVTFANDEARQQFIDYNKQLMTGGALDMQFVGNLERAELMRFDSDADREAFMNEINTNLSPLLMTEENLAAAIIEIAERNPGAHFVADDPDFDNNVYYQNIQQRLMEQIQHVKPPANARAYAEAVEDYIANHDGIESNVVLDAEAPVRNASALDGQVRGMSDAGDSVMAELAEHRLITPQINYDSADAQNAVLDAFDQLDVNAMRAAALGELGVDDLSGVDLSNISPEKLEGLGISQSDLDQAMQQQYNAAIENIVSGIDGASMYDPAAIAEANLQAAQGGLAPMNERYEYGQPITINQDNFGQMGFARGDIPMYGFSENGVMNMQEANGVAGIPDGASVVINPAQIGPILGADEFEARAVYDSNGDRVAYFVSNEDGEGFLIDKDAIDHAFMRDNAPEMFATLNESPHTPPAANIDAAPVAANIDRAPSQDTNNPEVQAGLAIGPQ